MNNARFADLDHARRAVATEIHHVMMAAYSVEAELLGVTDFVPLRRRVDEIMEADSTFLGAFYGDALVAVAELEVPPGGPVNVASLVVLPEHFRRGLGNALLHRVIAAHGDRGITVSTGALNSPALSLYSGLGFQEHRRWETADGIPMRTLLLAR